MFKCGWLFVFSCVFQFSFGQVLNNQISKRFQLVLDETPIVSTTANSSVEWQCINKALTNKCIVYHNDQWFTFSVANNGSYYINLSNQICRKNLGTQLILIEGNPCEIETYRIRKCIPQLPRENSYVKVDSLKAGITYLINIDGFLADECDFAIQVSTKPFGFPLPAQQRDTIEAKAEIKKEIVNLTWFIEENRTSSIRSFKVLRTSAKEAKGKEVNHQSLIRNTFGAYELRYALTDTLPRPGLYMYKIFGEQTDSGELVLLTTESARYQTKPVSESIQIQKEITLALNFETGFPFKVVVIDPLTSDELYKYQNRFEKAKDSSFKVDLSEFIDKGKKEFMIIATDFSSKGALEMYYRLNTNGKLVRQ
jgi:hypothetical protein